jgi:hypothetical protein
MTAKAFPGMAGSLASRRVSDGRGAANASVSRCASASCRIVIVRRIITALFILLKRTIYCA